LTDAQLLEFAGQDESKPIYLALNGTIFDVTAGRSFYGPGGSYSFFAGRDAARAYVTGCFKEDSVPDWRGAEWMFIPTDVPRFSETPDSELDKQRRLYRYQAVEKGLKEVDDTLTHWAKVFSGETGKDYTQVGYVKREEGWIEKLPLRELCEHAERKRPQSTFDKDNVYRRPQKMERIRAVMRWQTDDAKEKAEAEKVREQVTRDEL